MHSSDIQVIDTHNVSPKIRQLYVQASLVAIFGNVILLTTKGIAAYISRSSAVYADAANSASDVAYSLCMVLGLWLSLRPADASHPHGHRSIEPLVSVLIGAAMSLAGVQALRIGINTWRTGARAVLSTWPVVILLGTVVIKGIMHLVVRRIAEKAASPALRASARDNLSDVVSSGMALVGLVGSRYFFAADPLAAAFVAIWILRGAWEVLWESLKHLTGGAPPPELTQAVTATARGVPGVLNVHRVILHHVGPEINVDIHVEMDGHLALYDTHRVSDAVQEAVEALGQIDHAYVHVEPVEGQ